MGNKILEMFTNWLQDLVDMFVNFLSNILFNY